MTGATTESTAPDFTSLAEPPPWDEVAVGQQVWLEERKLDWQDVVLAISGSQDWHRVHFDHDFAVESGHREVFFNTGWTSAMLGRVLTDWCGSSGWLRQLEFQMRKMIAPGDTVKAGAEVTAKKVADGHKCVEFDVWLETDREGVTTRGRAVVTLAR